VCLAVSDPAWPHEVEAFKVFTFGGELARDVIQLLEDTAGEEHARALLGTG
jgi:hypothetical protein